MAEEREAPAARYLSPDMVLEILLRLPAADVNRHRVVCKLWRSIIDDHHLHSAHRRPMPLFFYRRDFGLGSPEPLDFHLDLVRVDLQGIDVAAREPRRLLRFTDVQELPALGFDGWGPDLLAAINRNPDSVFKVEGYCDGILLLSYHRLLYACNPCTRRWARLPPIHLDRGIVGFYADGTPGEGTEYRLLYGGISGYSIRSLDTGSVRQIGRPMSTASPAELDVVLRDGLCQNDYDDPPAIVEGRLFWRPQVLLEPFNNIVVFDMAAEVFSWLQPPVIKSPGRIEVIDVDLILEMSGVLAVATIDLAEEAMHTWMYIDETWVRRHRIRLPSTEIYAHHGIDIMSGNIRVLIISQELDVLVQCPYTLLQCDRSGEVLRYHSRPGHWTISTPYMFKGNFTLHAFLPMQGNTEDKDGELPIFQFQG